MPFKPGDKKPLNSGRKKGSPNKKRVPRVADFLAANDINPAQKILEIIAADQKLAEKDRMSRGTMIGVWMDLLEWCQPKPKEFDPDEDEIPEELQEAKTATLLKIIKDNNKPT